MTPKLALVAAVFALFSAGAIAACKQPKDVILDAAPAVTTTAVTTATATTTTPTATATETVAPLAHPLPPGHTAIKLADGGAAVKLPDGGVVTSASDAGFAWPFPVPSGLALPTAAPSGFPPMPSALPSTLPPMPSGMPSVQWPPAAH
jgi:hypothetical protein